MAIKQNINKLSVIMKSGSNANLDKIKYIIDLYGDRKMVDFTTARNIVVQLAHPNGYNRKSTESEIIISCTSICMQSQRQGI